jgi:hypothetical protein
MTRNYRYARPNVSKQRHLLIKLCAAARGVTPFEWLQAAIDAKAKTEAPELYAKVLDDPNEAI